MEKVAIGGLSVAVILLAAVFMALTKTPFLSNVKELQSNVQELQSNGNHEKTEILSSGALQTPQPSFIPLNVTFYSNGTVMV